VADIDIDAMKARSAHLLEYVDSLETAVASLAAELTTLKAATDGGEWQTQHGVLTGMGLWTDPSKPATHKRRVWWGPVEAVAGDGMDET